jgi:hypothetical protein
MSHQCENVNTALESIFECLQLSTKTDFLARYMHTNIMLTLQSFRVFFSPHPQSLFNNSQQPASNEIEIFNDGSRACEIGLERRL